MAVYCITYELNYDLKYYNNFFEALKSYAGWYKQGSNIWFISTNEEFEPTGLRDYLYALMYKNDKLFVIKVVGSWAGYGHPQSEYDWLKDNL